MKVLETTCLQCFIETYDIRVSKRSHYPCLSMEMSTNIFIFNLSCIDDFDCHLEETLENEI